VSPERTQTKVRILVVDDDVDLCRFMQDVLARDGYLVTTLSEATRAVDVVRKERPHIVVLDLMMPEMNGIDVLRAIRRFDSDVAIIIFTGYPSVDSAVSSMKLEAADYIKKPFDVAEFRAVIEKVIREKGLLADPVHDLLVTVGERLRSARRDQRLTLKELSRRASLSVSLLSQIERAESSASLASLYRIAQALDLSLSQLFAE